MLYLIQSNRMECLADHLLDWLAPGRQGQDQILSPLTPQTILVQSPGMAQWLRLHIAKHCGIAANLDFPLPSSFIWQLYRQHVPELPEQSAFNKSNMCWHLVTILPALLQNKLFLPLANYLQDCPADEVDQRLYQLCSRIADLFDQYLMYRPDWINAWQQGIKEPVPGLNVDGQEWQPALWRALCKAIEEKGEAPFHRANLQPRLLDALRSQELADNQPLLVFGLSAMPAGQLAVLAALAEQREVVIFWLNPCEAYWGDIVDGRTQAKAELVGQAAYFEQGNPLLASWGKLGRDFHDMLTAHEPQQHDAFATPENNNLLGHIQREVLALTWRGSVSQLSAEEWLGNGVAYPKLTIHAQDRSLQLHACHSKVRELEVLHDQLLHVFERHPELSPADVIVMMPDVAVYAAAIDGVFGGAEPGLFIPYAISDRNLTDVAPVVQSILQLFALQHSRFGLYELLSLLEVPGVLRRFDLQESEFYLLQGWLEQVGVRWGFNGADKTRWDLPPGEQNTWLFGLQRLLAGYAMQGGELWQTGQQVIAPYVEVEGQQAQALGKLYLFVQALLDVLQWCLISDTLSEKARRGQALIERFYLPDEQESVSINQVREQLEQIKTLPCTGKVQQQVFVAELQQRLQQDGVSQRFLAGAVNFCTLMPMRSIPFKVVCLLGMNQQDYPRQNPPLGFDLIAQNGAQKGDRSRRLDDRYLFLEAILSARELLYISYQGFDLHNNAPLAPSLLVDELMAYCQQTFVLDGQMSLTAEQCGENLLRHLRFEHALQPFNPQYFQPGTLQSFQEQWLAVQEKMQQAKIKAQQALRPEQLKPFFDATCDASVDVSPQSLQAGSLPESLSIDELVGFFLHPLRAFCQHRWQVSLYRTNQTPEQHEPFELDKLTAYWLAHRQLSSLLHNNDAPEAQHYAQWQQQWLAEGVLPADAWGQRSADKLSADVAALHSKILTLTQGKTAQNHAVQLTFTLPAPTQEPASGSANDLGTDGASNHIRLEGWQDQLYGEQLVLWRPGSMRGQDMLTLWLRWLCLCASDAGLSYGRFVSLDGIGGFAPLDKTDAIEQLQGLLRLYQQGLQQPLYFMPALADALASENPQRDVQQAFYGHAFKRGVLEDTYVTRFWPTLDTQLPALQALSEQIYLPAVNAWVWAEQT